MFGFKPVKFNGFYETVTKTIKSNTTITEGDPVSLEDDTAIVSTAGLAIHGVAQETVVNPLNGTSTVKILCGKDIQYLIDNDNDTNTFAGAGYGGGKYFDMVGTTGAVLIDTSTASATAGQVVCIDEAPDASDASIGLFKNNSAETTY
jgi:hypothetical protein